MKNIKPTTFKRNLVKNMTFLTAHHTDVGIVKDTNQDALLIKTATSSSGDIGFFVVCDGMGGLSSGEIASSTVVQMMNAWFDHELPSLLSQSEQLEDALIASLNEKIHEANQRILAYGNTEGIQLGTTITALMIIGEKYYTFQIGDSRAYIVGEALKQLTIDQTFIAREIAHGNLTKEEAVSHPNRSVLLQCVGASPEIEVVVSSGFVQSHLVFLLCTDGFYHEISDIEIIEQMHPAILSTEQEMENTIIELIDIAKKRQEVDNISVVLVKVI